MAKINVVPITGAQNLSAINNNFDKIATALNDGALWRDNPVGQPNQMENDLDMNGQRVYNLPKPVLEHEAARLVDLKDQVIGGAYKRTLRVGDVDINSFPSVANRANKLMSFDAQGQPVVQFPSADSATQLRIDLQGSEGSSLVGLMQSGSGATVRTLEGKLTETVSVKDFGAVGDGVTDETLAISLAIGFLESVGGGCLTFPSGVYKTSSALPIPAQIDIVGASRWATVVSSSDLNSPIFEFGPTSHNCSVRSLNLQYQGLPVAGADAIKLDGCQTFSADQLWISSSWNGLAVYGGGNHQITNYWCYSYENTAVLMSAAIDVNISCFRFNAGDSVKGRSGGIRLQGGVEAFTASQGDITLGVYGLTTTDFGSTARGSAPHFNRFTSVFFDSPLKNPASLVSLAHTDFIGCWFASGGHDEAVGFSVASDFAGIEMDKCSHLSFIGGDAFNNGGRGALVYNTNKFITFSGSMRFKQNQFSRVSDGDAITFLNGTTNFAVKGCIFERDTDTVNYRQTVAVGVAAGASGNYIISENMLGGCTISDGGTGDGKVVTNNPGYNPLGIATVPVGASPFLYKNNSGSSQVVSVVNGTVSAINSNGLAVTPLPSGNHIIVPSGKSMTVTYSSTPDIYSQGL